MTIQKLKDLIEEEGIESSFLYKEFECLIVRIRPETSGYLCGYIKIPMNHRFYGKSYADIDETYDYEIPSHGGLTFSGELNGRDGYWIGFDCSHSGDLIPRLSDDDLELFIMYGDVYRDLNYVMETLRKMIDFLRLKGITPFTERIE